MEREAKRKAASQARLDCLKEQLEEHRRLAGRRPELEQKIARLEEQARQQRESIG